MKKIKLIKPKDLPIAKYIELMSIIEQPNRDWESNIDILATCSNMSRDEILNLTPAEFNDYSITLTSAIESENKSLMKNIHFTKPTNIVLNNSEYTVNYNIDKLTMAQYIDFQTYVYKDNTLNNLGNILSVFIIPKGHKYNEGYDINVVQDEIFNYMPISLASEISFFLKKRSLISMQAKMLYSILQMKLLKWTTRDKERKQQLQEIITKMKEARKQISDYFSMVG